MRQPPNAYNDLNTPSCKVGVFENTLATDPMAGREDPKVGVLRALSVFFTSLNSLKTRVRFANNVQASFAFDYLAIRMALFRTAQRIKYLHD